MKSIAAFHTGYTKSIPPFAVDAANEFTKIALTQSGQTGSFATTNQANFAAVSNGTLTLNPASTTFSPTLSVGAMRGRYFSYLINQIPGTFINDYKRATIDASTILLDGELFEENLLIDSTGSSQPGVFTKTGNGIGFITTTRAFVNITSIICQTINNVNGQVDVISDNPGNSTSDEASGIKIRTYVPTQTSATVGTAMKVAIQIKGF